ncbi:hypothetical protein IV102_05870 [bacterium]|nr:hypothetical protein [bacterium]
MREILRLPDDFRKRPATVVWGGLGWALALLFGGLYLADSHPPEVTDVPVRPVPRPQELTTPVVLKSGPVPAIERIESLLAHHQPQQALAEIARTWADCEHRNEAPPAELPDLFARSVAALQESHPRQPPPPTPSDAPSAPAAQPWTGERPPRLADLPGQTYPLARTRKKIATPEPMAPPTADEEAWLPPLPPPPPVATVFHGPPPGQPPPPPPAGGRNCPPGY